MTPPTYETLLALAERIKCDHCNRPLRISMSELRALLATQGLSIVDATRVSVLERIAKYAREDRATTPKVTRLARALAELARRKPK